MEKELQRLLKDLAIEVKNERLENEGFKLIGFFKIVEFFQKEKEYWESISSSNLTLINAFKHHFKTMADELTGLNNYVNSQNVDLQQFHQRWNQLKARLERQKTTSGNYTLLYSRMPESNFVKQLFSNSEHRGEGALKYFSDQIFSQNNKEEAIGFMEAYEFDHQRESKIVKRRVNERKSLNQIRNEWLQTTQDLNKSFEDYKTDFNNWKEEFIKEHTEWRDGSHQWLKDFIEREKKRLEDVNNTYVAKLRLEGPVTYWQKRAKLYRDRGKLWLVGLSVSVGIIIAIMLLILYKLPEPFHYKIFSGDPEAIKGIIILATIISLGIYVARVFAKLTFSSFHIERDAEEREQLTMVYLALLKGGDISDREREIILQALFSRVETGLISGDSSPTIPGVNALLDKINK